MTKLTLTITHMVYRWGYRYEKNSNSVNMRSDLNSSEESKNTPTEHVKLIIVGMVTPY